MGPPPGFTAAAAAMGIQGSEEMAAQAARLWEMMDDLAKNDPEGYQRFVAKQLKEKERYEKANKPPDAVFGVRFKNVGDGGALVWVNFCSSPRVQAPVTAADAIPVVVLEPTTQPVNDGGARATLYEAVLHPSVIERMNSNEDFKAELIKVGLGCVEERSRKLDAWPDVRVDHATVRVRDTPFKKKTLKEKLQEAAAAVGEPFDLRVPAPGAGKTTRADQRHAPSSVSASPDIIIPGLGEVGDVHGTIPDQHSDVRSNANDEGTAVVLPGSRHPPKPVSIVELASSVTEVREGSTIAPSHTCVHDDAAAAVLITVDLPEVNSVEEITLDVETRQLSLSAPGYALTLSLPCTVAIDDTRAKFKKKSHQLVLSLPTIPQ